MKKLPIILYSILLAIMLGLLGYEVFYLHNSDSGFYLKAGLALIAILAAMIRSATGSRRRVSNKKAVYSKAYAPFIGSAFSREPKLEKRFYNAVDLYNRNKPAAAVTQLEKLRTHCSHSDDYYALTVFTALCYDEMRLYAEAAALYEKAVQMRPNSTLVSNMGCASTVWVILPLPWMPTSRLCSWTTRTLPPTTIWPSCASGQAISSAVWNVRRRRFL